MKFTVGFTVWNKVDMLSWLLEGLVKNFSPANTDVVFHFDACTDSSVEAFDALVLYWLYQRGGFAKNQVHRLVSLTPVRELGGHNQLMRWFMAHQPRDFLIVAQDDQHFDNAPCPFLEGLAAQYGPRLGLIGGRDGYGVGYSNFTGSAWSESTVQRRLRHGEFVPLPYMNSGPIVYNPHLIGCVGFLDDGFQAFYVWDDYGHRAIKEGFVNGVMGMDLTHAKFGRCTNTTFYEAKDNYAAKDLARRQAKHGF